MKLRVEKNKLNIENMRQLVKLIDAGVLLVYQDEEPIESIQNAPDYKEEKIWAFDEKTGDIIRREKTKPLWVAAEIRKLKRLRAKGMRNNDIAVKLGNKTQRQVLDKISNMKKAGTWNANLRFYKSKRKVPKYYFTREVNSYVTKAKKMPSAKIINKKFGTGFTEKQIRNQYEKLKGGK